MTEPSDRDRPAGAAKAGARRGETDRAARLAEALRANLRRRKAQAMARRQPDERPDRG
ncbi:MAG: hypothetical protein JKP97_07610 [Rhodobacteraceae bacterium]|jgi:hypothetical protein|nr:hypothetical protein [Paracoccaceae bacterium]